MCSNSSTATAHPNRLQINSSSTHAINIGNLSLKPLKIVQINMGRTATAIDLLLKYCLENKIDIALLQEPYTNRDRMIGFETKPLRSYLSKPTVRQGNNCNVYGAAVIIFNPAIRALVSPDLCTEYIVTVTIEPTPGNLVSIISSYFKYRIPTSTHTITLNSVTNKITHEYIIGMDSNASSTLWFSQITNRRGELVEEYIASNYLTLHNKPSAFHTFAGPRGNSNIDLTISTARITEKIGKWEVVPHVTTSDHNMVYYELSQHNCVDATIAKRRFATDKANWTLFREALAMELLKQELQPSHNINTRAATLNEALVSASIASIPNHPITKRPKLPWWSKDLLLKRRLLRSASRQRHANNHNIYLNQAYRTARNSYTTQLRNEKRNSWRTFCTNSGVKPWGKLYRWLRKGSSSHKIPIAGLC